MSSILRTTGEPMRVSMTLPTMAGGNNREQTLRWSRTIDDGPFHSLAIGERVGFDNPEQMTTLAFAAAVTERVRLVPTIVILPMHPETLMAKKLATVDVLSNGRVTVGVGVGGRDEDFAAAGGAPYTGRHQRLDDQMQAMKAVWAGETPPGVSRSVGPTPIGTMPVLSGSLGPKAVARASKWGDGVAGFSLDPVGEDWAGTAQRVRDAWAEGGGESEPYLATTFWYRGSEAADPEGLQRYAYEYLKIFGDEGANAMASMTTAVNLDATIAALDAAAAGGFDEVFLVPTSADGDELDALTARLASRR